MFWDPIISFTFNTISDKCLAKKLSHSTNKKLFTSFLLSGKDAVLSIINQMIRMACWVMINFLGRKGYKKIMVSIIRYSTYNFYGTMTAIRNKFHC